jgi:cytochrome c biogenesis factor
MSYFRNSLMPYMTALLGVHRTRLTQARDRGDAGASAVELAIITAIVLGIAAALLVVIQTFVNKEQTKISGTDG